jgi:hypothetical protein
MIDKYVAAIILVISNILGLSILSSMDNNTVEAKVFDDLLLLEDHQKLLSQHRNEENDFRVPVVITNTVPVINTNTVPVVNTTTVPVINTNAIPVIEHYGITFKYDHLSWLPQLAAQAGWPQETLPMLKIVILKESGGCPNRRGGDVVDGNCNIIGVSEWNHRSDTGLMQINGINYNLKRNKWAAVCLQLSICTQEPLLDPLNNLKAGKVLYDLFGWGPWDPCTWGPEHADKCKRQGKLKP